MTRLSRSGAKRREPSSIVAPVDGRSVLLNVVSEKQWLEQIVRWAKRGGFLTYHSWSSIHSAAGFPDLVCLSGSGLLFFEAKTERGRVSAAQQKWIDALTMNGQRAFIVRPSDEPFVRELLGV